jgi:hypothetical protein
MVRVTFSFATFSFAQGQVFCKCKNCSLTLNGCNLVAMFESSLTSDFSGLLSSTFAVFEKAVFQQCPKNRTFAMFRNTSEKVRVSKNYIRRDENTGKPVFLYHEKSTKVEPSLLARALGCGRGSIVAFIGINLK